MKKVAITGGIGSGKSAVLDFIAELGYPVFSCDEIYKEVIVSQEYVKEMEKIFPDAINDGIIDRKVLGALVFNNANAREQLNRIAHPLIMKKLNISMENAEKSISFAEVPLLFEGGLEKNFDFIIVVMRDFQERIIAVQKRDGLTEEDFIKRTQAQFNYNDIHNQAYLKTLPVYIIENRGNLNYLKEQTKTIIQMIESK